MIKKKKRDDGDGLYLSSDRCCFLRFCLRARSHDAVLLGDLVLDYKQAKLAQPP